MRKSLITAVCTLLLLAGFASAQTVIITDFPVGVGGSVDQSVFAPYLDDLRAVADTLKAYPLARAIITGSADGIAYQGNHDAKNPGVALGRAHWLRNMLVSDFGVDPAQLSVQSEDVAIKGGPHRFASVRVDRSVADLDKRVAALEQREPVVEKHFTEVKETPVVTTSPFDVFGLQFGLGGSSSPFGFVPMISAAVTWERVVLVEGFVGHTFWNGSFRWQGTDLDTKRRFIGGQAIVFPFSKVPVGVVGGWIRVEEISQQHYEYTKLSEGPRVGLRAMPIKYLSATATWDPAKHRISGNEFSTMHDGQVEIAIQAHYGIGGAK
jgi:hypothetical protein